MDEHISCTSCGSKDVHLCDYETMMVLRHDTALFTVRCPECHALVNKVHKIPGRLQGEIRSAARAAGAGMGRTNIQ